MKNITLDLTQQEAAALVQLMDMGVKAGGINVAAAAAALLRKINDAAQAGTTARPNGTHAVAAHQAQ
jgi:predicted DNA-binding transcriptional regulator YafY